MLVYTVTWKADRELTQGKGRVTRNDFLFCFNVLCRNSKDATSCLEYLFPLKYPGKFSLCDGEVTIRRHKIDSRGFEIQYLLMDGMKKPLYLSNVRDSIDLYNNSLYQSSVYNQKLI